MKKKTRQEAIDELTLMLAYLTRFSDEYEDIPYIENSWKNYDFDAVERLDEKDLLFAPKGKCVYMTEKGRELAKALIEEHGYSDTDLYEKYSFRNVKENEGKAADDIELRCFPANEACTLEHMEERVKNAPELFYIAEERASGKPVGFVTAIATNEDHLKDEFYTDISLHDPDGKNIMILSVAVDPEYRKQGIARELVYTLIRAEKEKGRKNAILTCLQPKVKMYKKWGFRDLGDSASSWGGDSWHEMAVILNY